MASAGFDIDDDIYGAETDESLLARFDHLLRHPDMPVLVPRLYAPEVRAGAITSQEWWRLFNELEAYCTSGYPPLPRLRNPQ